MLQGVWAACLVLPRTYDPATETYGNLYSNLLDYVISAALIFYILTIAGIFRLRRTRPDAERPYRAFGYPVVPALYIVGAAAILVVLFVYRPADHLARAGHRAARRAGVFRVEAQGARRARVIRTVDRRLIYPRRMKTAVSCAVAAIVLGSLASAAPQTQAPAAAHPIPITAKAPPGPIKPAWDRGIQPISRESYWNAVECGKQKGGRPTCVFPDADLCKNSDYALALFTPYKQVAYEVWQDVSRGYDPPTPNYAAAQQTRVTVGVTPVVVARNPIVALAIRRGGHEIKPATQSIDTSGGGRFIFDFAPFEPTEPITIEMTGKVRTIACRVGVPVLKALR